MQTYMKEPFEQFLSQLKKTNATLAYYSDFKKVRRNVADIEISLNTLNYLIGKDDLRSAVEALWRRDPRCFEVMDILIATRKKEKKLFLNDVGEYQIVHSLLGDVDGIMMFLNGTGLSYILKNKEIKNLVDYVFGVETGLDSHSRKNRSGEIMEEYVAKRLSLAGISYESQVRVDTLPAIKKVFGKDDKRVDFVITTPKTKYIVEVNFYSTSGSKPNEVARAYNRINAEISKVDGYRFAWITDGQGWLHSKSMLTEAYESIPLLFNITTMNDFIEMIKAECCAQQ